MRLIEKCLEKRKRGLKFYGSTCGGSAVSVLIAGTFSLGSAFAVEQGDVISFKGKTNKVNVDSDSVYPSKAKARVGIQLTVNGANAFTYDGLGRIVLEIKFKANTGVQQIVLSSGNSFNYIYDHDGNILTIPQTQIQDESGKIWTFSGIGSYDLDTKNKSRSEITLSVGGQEGEEIFTIPTLGGVMMMPITS